MHHAVSGVQSVRGSLRCTVGSSTCRKYQVTTVRIYIRKASFFTPDCYGETFFSLECGVVADHLLSSSITLCVDCDGDRGKGQNATTGISRSALPRTGWGILIVSSVSTLDISYHTWIFPPLIIEYFAFLKNGDSLQAEGEQLHPNQTAERTSAH